MKPSHHSGVGLCRDYSLVAMPAQRALHLQAAVDAASETLCLGERGVALTFLGLEMGSRLQATASFRRAPRGVGGWLPRLAWPRPTIAA